MTDRQKERLMLYAIIKANLKNKFENEDELEIATLETIKKYRDSLKFEEIDSEYKKAVRNYRKVHKDE